MFTRRPLSACVPSAAMARTGARGKAVFSTVSSARLAPAERMDRYLDQLAQAVDPVAFTNMLATAFPALVTMGAYLAELFDTQVRSTGTAVSFNLADLAGGARCPLTAAALSAHPGPTWVTAARSRLPVGIARNGTRICKEDAR